MLKFNLGTLFARRQRWSAVVLLLLAGTAAAHHSFAMYDNEKVVTVTGTVAEFKWANPHVILRISAAAAEGDAEELWTLELTAPGQLVRNGWSHTTLKKGDKVTAELHPFRDGRLGGSFMSVATEDGRVISR